MSDPNKIFYGPNGNAVKVPAPARKVGLKFLPKLAGRFVPFLGLALTAYEVWKWYKRDRSWWGYDRFCGPTNPFDGGVCTGTWGWWGVNGVVNCGAASQFTPTGCPPWGTISPYTMPESIVEARFTQGSTAVSNQRRQVFRRRSGTHTYTVMFEPGTFPFVDPVPDVQPEPHPAMVPYPQLQPDPNEKRPAWPHPEMWPPDPVLEPAPPSPNEWPEPFRWQDWPHRVPFPTIVEVVFPFPVQTPSPSPKPTPRPSPRPTPRPTPSPTPSPPVVPAPQPPAAEPGTGSQPPSYGGQTPYPRAPRPGEREPPKSRVRTVAGNALRIMDLMSEGAEVVDCIYKSMPKVASRAAARQAFSNRMNAMWDRYKAEGIGRLSKQEKARWFEANKPKWNKAWKDPIGDRFKDDLSERYSLEQAPAKALYLYNNSNHITADVVQRAIICAANNHVADIFIGALTGARGDAVTGKMARQFLKGQRRGKRR